MVRKDTDRDLREQSKSLIFGDTILNIPANKSAHNIDQYLSMLIEILITILIIGDEILNIPVNTNLPTLTRQYCRLNIHIYK